MPCLMVVAALLAGTVWAWNRQPALGFLGAWFFLILAPTSSFIPIADPIAEHRMYLPLAAVVTGAVLVAFALGKRFLRNRSGSVLGWVACGFVVAPLAILTIQRNRDYISAVAIWQDTVARRPNNPRAHNNLGGVLLLAGRVQEAIGQCEQALRIKPNYAEAHGNLGNALAKLGRNQDAIRHYEQALEIDPKSAQEHYDLANALFRVGKVTDAITHYRLSLQSNPKNADAHSKLGAALNATGNAHDALGQWEQALRINPDLTEAQNNLAWVLATLPPTEGGDAVRAVGLAQRACELTGNRAPGDLDTLAVAYAATGRFDDAIATARTAIDLARAAGQAELAKEIKARLELYRTAHAYRPSTGVTNSGNP